MVCRRDGFDLARARHDAAVTSREDARPGFPTNTRDARDRRRRRLCTLAADHEVEKLIWLQCILNFNDFTVFMR